MVNLRVLKWNYPRRLLSAALAINIVNYIPIFLYYLLYLISFNIEFPCRTDGPVSVFYFPLQFVSALPIFSPPIPSLSSFRSPHPSKCASKFNNFCFLLHYLLRRGKSRNEQQQSSSSNSHEKVSLPPQLPPSPPPPQEGDGSRFIFIYL